MPVFDLVRSTPRYAALRRRRNLPWQPHRGDG
jgi:hypothetical protein